MGIINPIYVGLCWMDHHRIFGKARCLIRTLVQGKELQFWWILFFTLDIMKKPLIHSKILFWLSYYIKLQRLKQIFHALYHVARKVLIKKPKDVGVYLWCLKIKCLAAAIDDIRKCSPHRCTNAGLHLCCIQSRATKTSKISMNVK